MTLAEDERHVVLDHEAVTPEVQLLGVRLRLGSASDRRPRLVSKYGKGT
jgi:hypothetical protein